MIVKQFEVWLINLDPTMGSEIKKTRPCVVVSPNVINKFLNTVIVSPLTSTSKDYPSRVDCLFQGQSGQIALDQIRSVDKVKLIKKLGNIDKTAAANIITVLKTMFSA